MTGTVATGALQLVWVAVAGLLGTPKASLAQGKPAEASSDPCHVNPVRTGDRLIFRQSLRGDVLALGVDGKPSILQGAQVVLSCHGKKSGRTDGSDQWRSECESTLIVCPSEPSTAPPLRAADALSISSYKADGGTQVETLKLSLFALPADSAALIRVSKRSTEDCCGSRGSSTEDSLYLLQGKALRRVLRYTTASQSTPSEGPATKSRATLRADPTRTNGLTDLILSAQWEVSPPEGPPKRTRSTRRYLWNGRYFDSCGTGCSPSQRCCNGECLASQSALTQCIEDERSGRP